MTIAAGCTNKNLVRLGGGSVRSLVVLVFLAISAYMSLKGLFAQWRSSYLDPVTIDLSAVGLTNQSLASLLEKLTGMPGPTALLATIFVLGLGLLVFALKEKRFRDNASQVFLLKITTSGLYAWLVADANFCTSLNLIASTAAYGFSWGVTRRLA